MNIIKNIILAFMLFSVCSFCAGKVFAADENYVQINKFYEKDYVKAYCKGEIEYTLEDRTRIDCLTNEYAIEFDYAKKWAESIGQSLYYSKKTGKKPAVAIIVSSPSDQKYIERIKDVDKNIKIFEIPSIDYKETN